MSWDESVMKLVCFTLLLERRCENYQNQDGMDVVFGYLVNPVIRASTRGISWSDAVAVIDVSTILMFCVDTW